MLLLLLLLLLLLQLLLMNQRLVVRRRAFFATQKARHTRVCMQYSSKVVCMFALTYRCGHCPNVVSTCEEKLPLARLVACLFVLLARPRQMTFKSAAVNGGSQSAKANQPTNQPTNNKFVDHRQYPSLIRSWFVVVVVVVIVEAIKVSRSQLTHRTMCIRAPNAYARPLMCVRVCSHK